MHYSEDDNADTPLLQATSPEPGLNTYSIRLKPWPKRHPRLIMALVAALSFSVALAVIARHGRKEIDPSALSHIPTPNSTRIGPDIDEWRDRPNLDDPVVAARLSVDALFARQSSTIKQAMARYSLKTGQPPPPNYDKWFKFAREKSCLLDDYDQIHRDFKPFYELAQDVPHFFQRRLDIAFDMVRVPLPARPVSRTSPLDERQPQGHVQRRNQGRGSAHVGSSRKCILGYLAYNNRPSSWRLRSDMFIRLTI
jgi:hypothetical protein